MKNDELIQQARECAACMIGADECHRESCKIDSCADVIDLLSDALEVAQKESDTVKQYAECVKANAVKINLPESEYIDLLTARAEKAEAENRWITVSERLPEFNESVLIAYEIRGKRCIAIDKATCSNSGIAVWFSVGYACKVTHWRPLPEPPKGE